MTLHCAHPAAGRASIRFPSGRQLVYRCDPSTHLVLVTDADGTAVGGFGGRGDTPGRLDTPLDVTFVRPTFADEHLSPDDHDAVWLAVADYGNRRLQLFELDGVWVSAVPVEHEDGSPWAPSGLEWRAPFLDLEGVDGARMRVYLTASLLAREPAGRERRPALLRALSEGRH